MEIHGDQRPIDPVTRRRQTEAAASRSAAKEPEARRADEVELGDTSPQAIARFVALLKAMNPADLHKVEELRARIKDGTFSASANDLAGPLSKLLDEER